MTNLETPVKSTRLIEAAWWFLFLVCLVYAGFAFDMFSAELSRLLGATIIAEAKVREAPIAFMFHAVLGGVGLVAGALQFNGRIRTRNIRVHRAVGWIYLLSIWGASTAGVWNALYFDVPISARVIFATVGLWWFYSTARAYSAIRRHAVSLHREWVFRSYATSLFFITFSIWVPSLQALAPDAIAWPVGLLLAILLNSYVAEYWIRKFRS